MKFKKDFLYNYIKVAPIALASERALECEILSKQKFESPILDIGCGDGIFTSVLFENKIDTGIDPNLTEINRCDALGVYKELIQCSGSNIPKPLNSYKTIMSNSVLEHIPDLKPVLKEAYRVLDTGGSFYITIPSANFERASAISRILKLLRLDSANKKYCKFYNNFWRHYNCFEIAEWKKTFEEVGFKVDASIEYNSTSLATFHDLMAPLAISSMICRKYLKRWFLFPRIRHLISPTLFTVINKIVKFLNKENKIPTLIFFHLTK